MNKTILITKDENGTPWVSARSLCLAISRYRDPEGQFVHWIDYRFRSFVADKDYFLVARSPNPAYAEGRSSRKMVKDYRLSFAAAIEIARKEPAPWAVEYLENYQREQETPAQQPAPLPLFDAPVQPASSENARTEPVASAATTPRALQLMQQLQEELAKQQTEQPTPANLSQLQGKIDALEAKVWLLATSFQQIGNLLLGNTLPSTEEAGSSLNAEMLVPEIPAVGTPRAQLVQIVNDYAEAKNVTHQDVWRWLYSQLNSTYHFNVSRHKSPSAKTYLDVVEQHDQLSNLHAIAAGSLATRLRGAQA